VRVIIEKWDHNEYGYRFIVRQWKFVGPLVELVCELTEYEPVLERWSYRKKGYKSYKYSIRKLIWVNSYLLCQRLGVDIRYFT